jgi:phospholipid N-methyltransferase
MSQSRTRGLDRLGGLKQVNQETGAEMQALGERFDGLEGKKPIVVSSFNLFPTPPEIATKMIEWCDISPHRFKGQRILEPSFGTGRLLEAMLKKNLLDWNLVTGVEINQDLVNHIQNHRWNATLICADFLDMGKTFGSPIQYETFDRIVMNPPFKNGCDRHHIDHALKFLKTGGILVTLLANGPRQRDWFAKTSKMYPNACWRDLPAGSFKCEGTSVDVGMVQITR